MKTKCKTGRASITPVRCNYHPIWGESLTSPLCTITLPPNATCEHLLAEAVEGGEEIQCQERRNSLCTLLSVSLLGLPLFHEEHCASLMSVLGDKLIQNISNGSWLKDYQCLCCRKIFKQNVQRSNRDQRTVRASFVLSLSNSQSSV